MSDTPKFVRSVLPNAPVLQVDYAQGDGFTCFAYNNDGDRQVQHVPSIHIDGERFFVCTKDGEPLDGQAVVS